jgi:hypothetical protein
MVGCRAASDATLNASAITAVAPNSGHGGSAQSTLIATLNRNRCPSSASHSPWPARGLPSSTAAVFGAAYFKPQR